MTHGFLDLSAFPLFIRAPKRPWKSSARANDKILHCGEASCACWILRTVFRVSEPFERGRIVGATRKLSKSVENDL